MASLRLNPKRFSPAQSIGMETKMMRGDRDVDHISTSFVERQNLNMRMGCEGLLG
jgi:hypothetical protein